MSELTWDLFRRIDSPIKKHKEPCHSYNTFTLSNNLTSSYHNDCTSHKYKLLPHAPHIL